ncbi:MAG: HD domain-containing protein [Thermoprotei archaeon]|nr:HD domain-containing protein [Thermoprotei archaeon]
MERIRQLVKDRLQGIPGHGYDHVRRVLNLALRIAQSYSDEVDIEVLTLAALLHDLGRPLEEARRIHHALISAEMAEGILREIGMSDEKIRKVVEAIKAHSYTMQKAPKSIEARILSDADKLDAIGAIGVARCFMEAGRRGRSLKDSIEHFHAKLLKLKDLMYTEEARRLALERHEFMERFLKRLMQELRGEA